MAGDVCLADAIDPINDVMHHETFLFGNPLRGKADPCPVHDRWGVAVTGYETLLETTTLEDPAQKEPRRRNRRREPKAPACFLGAFADT